MVKYNRNPSSSGYGTVIDIPNKRKSIEKIKDNLLLLYSCAWSLGLTVNGIKPPLR